VGFAFPTDACLMISRPETAEELFLSKNKYFDKHPKSQDLFRSLLGDSILFSKSDLQWQTKRKALSAALYKDKLTSMIETMKRVTIDIIQKDWIPRGQIEIVRETSNLFITITLKCLFGDQYENSKCNLRVKGVEKEVSLGETIILLMENTLIREFQPHLIFIEELIRFNIT
jgi:cytochrome P450